MRFCRIDILRVNKYSVLWGSIQKSYTPNYNCEISSSSSPVAAAISRMGTPSVTNSLFEKILFCLVEFNDKALAVFARASNIKDCFAVKLCRARCFVFGVFEIADAVFWWQKRIEEIKEEVFMRLNAEEFFEAEIGEGVAVALFHGHLRGVEKEINTRQKYAEKSTKTPCRR